MDWQVEGRHFANLCFTGNITLTLSTNSVTPGQNVSASGLADPDMWVPIKVLDSAVNIIVLDSVKKDSVDLCVINGYPGGGFMPDQTITQAEFKEC